MGVSAGHKAREHNLGPHSGCRVEVLVQQMLRSDRRSLIISPFTIRQGYDLKYLILIYMLPSQCREIILLDVRSVQEGIDAGGTHIYPLASQPDMTFRLVGSTNHYQVGIEFSD